MTPSSCALITHQSTPTTWSLIDQRCMLIDEDGVDEIFDRSKINSYSQLCLDLCSGFSSSFYSTTLSYAIWAYPVLYKGQVLSVLNNPLATLNVQYTSYSLFILRSQRWRSVSSTTSSISSAIKSLLCILCSFFEHGRGLPLSSLCPHSIHKHVWSIKDLIYWYLIAPTSNNQHSTLYLLFEKSKIRVVGSWMWSDDWGG